MPTAAELTAHAGKWLPEQAVPSVRVVLTALENRYGVRLRASALLRQPDLRHLARPGGTRGTPAAVGAS